MTEPVITPLAVITGASSGIGAATARRLAADGYRVVLIGRSRAKLEAVAESIGDLAVIEPQDASDGRGMLALASRICSLYGPARVLVNSAGLGAWKRIEETTPEEARQMMDAPYFAAFNATHAFLGGMLEAGRGVIIHVGSPASFAVWPSSVGYAAARWALKGLHEGLRIDLHGSGVHSCHVVFGKVSSAYFVSNENAEDRIPRIGRLIPTITPERCAKVIAKVVTRPRPEVLYPFALRANYWLFRLAPGLTRLLLRRTGYRPGAGSPR